MDLLNSFADVLRDLVELDIAIQCLGPAVITCDIVTTTCKDAVYKLYKSRSILAYRMVAYAKELGYEAGVRFDPSSPEWPVLFAILPEFGPVAWRVQNKPSTFDIYTTDKTYHERCNKFIWKVADLDC